MIWENKSNSEKYFASERYIARNFGFCVKDSANNQIKHNTRQEISKLNARKSFPILGCIHFYDLIIKILWFFVLNHRKDSTILFLNILFLYHFISNQKFFNRFLEKLANAESFAFKMVVIVESFMSGFV